MNSARCFQSCMRPVGFGVTASPRTFFLHRGAIRLIDFEGACLIDETDVLPWGSPNYVPPIYHGKFSRRPGTLEDDYALGVIAFQFASVR